MYAEGNPKSKKQLKERVASGVPVRIFAPGLGTPTENGEEYIEGPQYPAPHRWCATVQMCNGVITKVKN